MRKILVGISIVAMATASQADVIANWQQMNDVVSANTDITKTDTFDNTGGFQSPAIGLNGYAGPTVQSPNFYAAMSDTSDSFNVFNGGVNDLLGRVQAGGADTGTFSSMLVWDVSGAYTLESMQSFGFGTFGAGVSSGGLRFLFQASDNSWYASSSLPTGGTIADVTAESWSAYTPHAAGVAVIGAAATPSFDNIKSVGYFQEFTTTGGGGVFSTGILIEGTIVPEPSTGILLGFGALATLLVRRFRG